MFKYPSVKDNYSGLLPLMSTQGVVVDGEAHVCRVMLRDFKKPGLVTAEEVITSGAECAYCASELRQCVFFIDDRVDLRLYDMKNSYTHLEADIKAFESLLAAKPEDFETALGKHLYKYSEGYHDYEGMFNRIFKVVGAEAQDACKASHRLTELKDLREKVCQKIAADDFLMLRQDAVKALIPWQFSDKNESLTAGKRIINKVSAAAREEILKEKSLGLLGLEAYREETLKDLLEQLAGLSALGFYVAFSETAAISGKCLLIPLPSTVADAFLDILHPEDYSEVVGELGGRSINSADVSAPLSSEVFNTTLSLWSNSAGFDSPHYTLSGALKTALSLS